MQTNTFEVENCSVTFGTLAKPEPVFFEKAGPMDTVLLSAEQYQSFQVHQNSSSLGADLRPWYTAMAQLDVDANPSEGVTKGFFRGLSTG